MKKMAINIKVDSVVKEEAQKVAKELGFSLSGVINAYLKEFLRTRRINVGLREEELSDWAKRELKMSQADYRAGRSTSFGSEKEALVYLGSVIADARNKENQD
ncbi:MAG: hypothetical protein Q8P73_03310 [bacterium]|nr:hypothetical protein [bacterium]